MEYIIIVIFILICFLLYMVKEAFRNEVLINELCFPDFPDTFGEIKIFFISDIHRRKISKKIITDVKGKVDLVIIGGDLAEKGVPLEQVKNNLELLKELGPVYFVWGNNDYEVDYHELDALLLSSNVKILDNTAVKFESRAGELFVLLGVDDMNGNRDRIEYALKDAGDEGFRILVSHNPRISSKIQSAHNIRFVLSGHTHGGQIHILGFSPYEKGTIKKLNHTTQLISNGYGTTSLPLRLGAKAETHLIILKKG
ncbi:metallophosphoesterase [Bacillus sp. CGMCC 1.16607]|uniref:metallophosphoesterase n=1 Tax=Bacillus sp. CGMCC 1.16607 TaxID=3351842 RepID=UPI003626EDEF